MRYFWLFCALGALWGCRSVSEPSGTAIALFCSTSEQSKTDILTQDDEIAVFARIEGTEMCFLEAIKFTVKADGHSLMTAPAVAYPETNQAIHFFAYFPYHTGVFSVPSDQSQPEALKSADLCWATASSTPVAAPVALEFRHLMARLVVSANEPISGVLAYNVFSGGSRDVQTGTFIATTRSSLSTSGTELILPAQTVTRLMLTVSGADYTFDGSVSLEAGRTTTLDLTLHPNTKTATLSGSSVTDWELASEEGNPTHAVSNTLLLHWPSLPQGAAPDQVAFTIGGTDYAVERGITYANQTFTVPFSSNRLRYPYTISKIRFYQSNHLVQSCPQLLGSMIYKSGYSTVGVNPNAVKIGNLWWATGNLVASNATAGARGEGGCRIGAPADGGLYFQFGSLIGWKGGALANGGTGVGLNPNTSNNGTQWWDGADSYSWANDAMVWPTNLSGNPTSWPQGATTNQWYFGLQTDWSTAEQNIRDFPNLATGGLANVGVGDPCSYYLGGTWRLSTTAELALITGVTGSDWIQWTTTGVAGRWATADQAFDGVSGPGAWFGTGLSSGTGTPNSSVNAFFPASGYRLSLDGSFNYVTTSGNYWSSSVNTATYGYYLNFHEPSGVFPQRYYDRSYAFTARCVSE